MSSRNSLSSTVVASPATMASTPTSSSNGLEPSSGVSALLAVARAESVRADEATQSKPATGSQSARTHHQQSRLQSSLSRGQQGRVFFANAPLLSMPPVGLPTTETEQRLFLKMGAPSQASLLAMSGAQSQRGLQSQGSLRSQRGLNSAAPTPRGGLLKPSYQQQSTMSIASLASAVGHTGHYANMDPEDALYSPDMPQLVPYGSRSVASAVSPAAGTRASTTNLNGPLPLTVFQTPYSSFGVLPVPPASLPHPPQQPQQQRTPRGMSYTASLASAPGQAYPTSLSPLQPSGPGSQQGSHARLARTYLPLTHGAHSSLSSASIGSSVSMVSSGHNNSARLELLDYLQSPSCSLFATPLSVRGAELDQLLAMCGGLGGAMHVLRDLEHLAQTHRRTLPDFTALLEATRAHLMQPPPHQPQQQQGQSRTLTMRVQSATGGLEEKTQEFVMVSSRPQGQAQQAQPMNPPPPTKRASKNARKVAAALANGGVESQVPSPAQAAVERATTMRRVVDFFGSPECLLFPAAAASTASHEHDHPSSQQQDVQITHSDLASLIDTCGPCDVLMDYLLALNRAIGEAEAEQAASGVKIISPNSAAQPFRRFLDLLRAVQALHGRVSASKNATRTWLNSGLCVLLPRSGGSFTTFEKHTPLHVQTQHLSSAATEQAERRASAARLYGSTKSLKLTDSGSSSLASSPSSASTPPKFTQGDMDRLWLESSADVTKDDEDVHTLLKSLAQADGQTKAISKAPFLTGLIELTKVALTKARREIPHTTTVAKKRQAKEDHNLGGGSSGHEALTPEAQRDPAASFSLLTPRAQRFVVELTAFFRSPKCRVFGLATATTNANTPTRLTEPPTEDLLNLMRAAGERELLLSEVRDTPPTAGGDDRADATTSQQTNRALFFLSALNTSLSLPSPSSSTPSTSAQTIRDWPGVLSFAASASSASSATQGRLLQRLTDPRCRLFTPGMQVRRVPDGGAIPSTNLEDEPSIVTSSSRAQSPSKRSGSPNKTQSTTSTNTEDDASVESSPSDAASEHVSNGESERLLYLSRVDMRRLFFDSTGGEHVEAHLDAFEAAVPMRTFVDLNALVFATKVAHLLWLSGAKAKAAAAAGGTSDTVAAVPITISLGKPKVKRPSHRADAGAQTGADASSSLPTDPALAMYRQTALGSDDEDEYRSPRSLANIQGKSVHTQTSLSTAPASSTLLQPAFGNGMRLSPSSSNASAGDDESKATPTKTDLSSLLRSVVGGAAPTPYDLSLEELAVHLRSATVQDLLFERPLTITDLDLEAVLKTATSDRDDARTRRDEERAWAKYEREALENQHAGEVAAAQAQGRELPPPLPEVEVVVEPEASSTVPTPTTAAMDERTKCALILGFLHQLEAPAIAANAASLAGESSGVPVTHKFTTVAQLCDALYLEYALHRSQEDTLALLRSSRLLPEGTPSTSSGKGEMSLMPSRHGVTGGPHGNVGPSDVATLYRLARAGLYTPVILGELAGEHLRAIDIEGLASMVSASHLSSAGRMRASKACLLAHLTGPKVSLFAPSPPAPSVRVTDAQLDLLLVGARGSGSAALVLLHRLSLVRPRAFVSMDQVLTAVRFMMARPAPLKSILKALLSSPMCIVLNKRPERERARPQPTDSVVDRMWEAQGAAVDAIAHVQAMHADAQSYASFGELVSAIGAAHASARASGQQPTLLLMAHLCSPLSTLFTRPLYDTTITPKHLEHLLVAAGHSASSALFHLERLDTPSKTEFATNAGYEDMPSLIADVAKAHAKARVHEERLQNFLGSRACKLFPPVASSSLIWDEAAVERVLNWAAVAPEHALRLVQAWNESTPAPIFRDATELATALKQAKESYPALATPRQPNSLNNFGQGDVLPPSAVTPQSLDEPRMALPPSEPVRLSFPASPVGLIAPKAVGFVGVGLHDTPSVSGPFYSDGSLALDAEEGRPGEFICDPSTLYGDGSGIVSPQTRPASGYGVAGPPSLDHVFDLAMVERERETLVEYFSTRCTLFRDQASSELAVEPSHLDQACALAGGAKEAIVELARLDALGMQFESFPPLLEALAEACAKSRLIEQAALAYINPDEEGAAFAAQANIEREHAAKPVLPRPTSAATQTQHLTTALEQATADSSAEVQQFTDALRQELCASVLASGLLTGVATEEPLLSTVDANQLLLIGGDLEATRAHLACFKRAGRRAASAQEIAPLIEASKSSGVYASEADMASLASFLASSENALLKVYLADGPEARVSQFASLPPHELDAWLRACDGVQPLMDALAHVAKHNLELANKAVEQARADKEAGASGPATEPKWLVPRTPDELLAFTHDQSKGNDVKLAEAAAARARARTVLRTYLASDSCVLLSPAASEEDVLLSDEHADALLRALSPSDVARADEAEALLYAPTDADLEGLISRLERFDLVGRAKFRNVTALVAAANASAGLATDADSVRGAFASQIQRAALESYLTSDRCGLLPLDARGQVAALSPEQLDELLTLASRAARKDELAPLRLGPGPLWPRFITPLYRLQQRSISGGAEEYTDIARILEGLQAMCTEPSLPREAVRSAIAYLTSDECGLFSLVPEDAGLEVDELEVEDLLRLAGGWTKAKQALESMDACAVKVGSLRALQAKMQRSLAFGFFSSSAERASLLAYLHSGENTVLEFTADRSLTEAEADQLLLRSRGQGTPYLVQEAFPSVAKDHPQQKATSIDQLVQWLVATMGETFSPPQTEEPQKQQPAAPVVEEVPVARAEPPAAAPAAVEEAPAPPAIEGPSDDDRDALLAYLGSADLFLSPDASGNEHTMEIGADEVDELIMARGGLNASLDGLRGLEAQGWRVPGLRQLINLLHGQPAPGAVQLVLANGAPISVVPPPAAIPNLVEGSDVATGDYQLLLEFLGSPDCGLFEPLAAAGAELEITDQLLDSMLQAGGGIQGTLRVLRQLDAQGRGFYDTAALAEAVFAEVRAAK